VNRQIQPTFEVVFKYGIPTIILVWTFQALYTLVTLGPFSYFRLLGVNFIGLHTLTALTAFSFFFIGFLWFGRIKVLPTPARIVVAATLPVFGLLFYDLIESTLAFFVIGNSNPLIQLLLLSFCYLILHLYNRKYDFLKIHKGEFLLGLIMIIILSALLVSSGFFQALYLYDHNGGPSPHGWIWFSLKFVAVWMWVTILPE